MVTWLGISVLQIETSSLDNIEGAWGEGTYQFFGRDGVNSL
jgi:hypothetical protein